MEGGGLAAERISVSSSFLVLVLVLDPESLRSEDEDEHEGRGRFPGAIRPSISWRQFLNLHISNYGLAMASSRFSSKPITAV